MKFLLDTHVFLWFISGDARLAAEWRAGKGSNPLLALYAESWISISAAGARATFLGRR